MVIGILGPLDSARKISDYLISIDKNLEVKLYTKEKIIDSIELIKQCEAECDGIIFTGCGVDEVIQQHYELKKPNTFVRRSDTSILKVFWDMKNLNLNIDKISIDVVDKEMVEEVIEEFDINVEHIECFPFLKNIDEDECLAWHLDLYHSGRVNIIITAFMSIYNQLKKEGYPVFLLKPTKSLVKVCYDKIISQYAINKAEYSQIAVEILSFNNNKNNIENYYSNMIRKSDVDKFIIEYVRSINGALFPFGRNEYIIFSNKGTINKDSNYSRLSKLQKDIKSVGFSLCVGIGFGITAFKAETNAHKALQRSINSKDNDMYLIDEDENIRGPLCSEDEMAYCLIPKDKSIIEISESTGLGCETISKIIAISKTRNSNIYDSKELAGYLDISERSARRILQKIISANLGQIYSKESSRGAGRPKNLIEILF